MRQANTSVRSLVITSVLVLCLAAAAWAQRPSGERTMTGEEQKKLIEMVCERLQKTYIYPEHVGNIRSELLKKFEAGSYRASASPSGFAFQLNKDLQALTDDKHLAITFNPAQAADLASEPSGDYYTPAVIAGMRETNFEFRNMAILQGNVGYLDLREFCPLKYAGETAVAAMGWLANCSAVIIDLRYNGGGEDEMVNFLLSYFVPSRIELSTSYSRKDDSYYQAATLSYVPGKRLPDVPLYILISKSTFSAAEAFSYHLKALKRATLVGESTRGGENPVDIQALADEYVLFIPAEKIIRSILNENPRWEGIGIKPDIETESERALEVAHLEALKWLASKTDDAGKKRKYNWTMEGIAARARAFFVQESVLRSYEGTYRDYQISVAGGVLGFRRGGRTRMRMIPMAEDAFMVESLDNLRMKFVRDKSGITGLELIYDDGRIVKCPRT